MAIRRKKRQIKKKFSVQKWDPLFIIFEKHLYDFNYESRDLFIQGVVIEYLQYLSQQKVVVPPLWKSQMEKSLTEEIADMLVRRLYGCLTVEEIKEKTELAPILEKSEARKRYQKLVG